MDPGVAGSIAGAVSFLLTGLVRALGIPSEVRAHDAAVADRNDQLGTWVLGMNSVQAYYSRASYELEREEAAARAAERAEYAELQRQFRDIRRIQAYELGGLAALDEFDEWHNDGSTGLGDY